MNSPKSRNQNSISLFPLKLAEELTSVLPKFYLEKGSIRKESCVESLFRRGVVVWCGGETHNFQNSSGRRPDTILYCSVLGFELQGQHAGVVGSGLREGL